MNMKTITYDADKYHLVKYPTKRDYKCERNDNGDVKRNYKTSYIRATPAVKIRTDKVYAFWRKWFKDNYDVNIGNPDIYENWILLQLEHAVREVKLNLENKDVVIKLSKPLPKSAWIRSCQKDSK